MKQKPSIVIFTEFYPYGIGEEFLEDELVEAERYFKKILIVSFKKQPLVVTKYLPSNVELISIRDGISGIRLLEKRLLTIITIDFWRQLVLFFKERGVTGLTSILKTLVLEQSKISLLKENEQKWIGKYTFYYSYWLSSGASYLALRKNQLKGTVISRAHGYDCFFNRGYHPHRREQFERIDMFFPISEAGKQDLIRQGCPPDRTYVARLGVKKQDVCLNLLNNSEEKTIVSCSNIVGPKRLDLLIEALRMIDNIQIHWVHFGDGVLRNEIQTMAHEKLGTKDNISYDFKGWLSKDEIFNYYRTTPVDLFVNCSDMEGIPVSIMEAMAYGIPSLARNVGGNCEIVKDGVNGLLLPKKCSTYDLSKAILSVLTLPKADYNQLRYEAYRTFREDYDAEKNYSSFFTTFFC